MYVKFAIIYVDVFVNILESYMNGYVLIFITAYIYKQYVFMKS